MTEIAGPHGYVERYSYGPGWERVVFRQIAAIALTRGFTMHEHLDQVGLVHMGGRVYDPEIGRFLSPDPFVQHPASTQGFNCCHF